MSGEGEADQDNHKAPKSGGRFVKGKSGNPNGRPRYSKPQAEAKTLATDIIAQLTLPLMQGGVVRTVSLKEGLLHRTYEDALKGKAAARKKIIKMIAERDAIRVKMSKTTPEIVRPLFMFSPGDPSNADEAMLLLDIARHDPDRADYAEERAQLLLEPWAAQAALTRRKDQDLPEPKDVSEIKRCTRDANVLVWPRGVRE
jgi:hypothetical protein